MVFSNSLFAFAIGELFILILGTGERFIRLTRRILCMSSLPKWKKAAEYERLQTLCLATYTATKAEELQKNSRTVQRFHS